MDAFWLVCSEIWWVPVVLLFLRFVHKVFLPKIWTFLNGGF